MPYCTNCGEEVTDEQRYCSYCGEALGKESRRGKADRKRQPPGRNEADSARAGANEPSKTVDQSHTDGADQPRGGEQAQPPREVGSERRQSGHSSGEAEEGFQGDPPPEGYEDPPGVFDDQQQQGRRGHRKSTFELFSGGFKLSLGLPVVLLALFAAWTLLSALALVPPGFVLVGLVASGLVGLVGAGMAYVYSEAAYGSRETSVGDAWGKVAGQFVPLLLVWLLYTPVFVVGLMLFILPGLYIGGRFLLAFPAVVLDGEGPVDAFKTSWELTSGRSLKPIGFLVFAVLAVIALALPLGLVQGAVMGVLGIELAEFTTIDEAMEVLEQPDVAAVNAIFQGILLAVPTAAVQVAAASMYLEERYGSPE